MSDAGCYRLPLDQYPGMNRFVLDWLAGDTRFLPRSSTARPNGARRPPSALVDALIASNRRWGLDVESELRRWVSGQTQTIICGQQVGFAGGPLYTLVKLASLLKMKRDNEARGNPTTLFFWLATEDHDWAEAASIALPSHDPKRQRDLIWLRANRSAESRVVVGREPIPESLVEQLVATLQIERPRWLRKGITFSDSFGELLATVVGEKCILVDALLPELRRAAAPLFENIVQRWDDVQKSIAGRSAELQRAGYAPQVIAPREREPYTLLYHVDGQGNRELLQHPPRIDDPAAISTSALTRPLLQDFVFQPDVFVGGPAEVAYYAQIEPLHRLLDVPLPRVALRGHVLLAPKRVVRYFPRFEIEPAEVFTTPEKLVAAHEKRGVTEIQSVAEQAERELAANVARIRELAFPADHAVARSVNRSIGHIEYHFRKLTERATRALARKDRERFEAARELVSAFYPDQHVQDRVVAWLPYWCQYGEHAVSRVVDEVEPDTAWFKIVSL